MFYATLENTSATLTLRADQAGTMLPGRAVSRADGRAPPQGVGRDIERAEEGDRELQAAHHVVDDDVRQRRR